MMNRGARRLPIFDGPDDYGTFVRVLHEGTDRFPMRLLCWVVMPNHWHLVLWPQEDDDLSVFMAWITATHSRRWHVDHNSVGTGTIYQGRFKAIPVKDDVHFLTVCRYVERNPMRARLVQRVEDWKWSSAAREPRQPNPRLHEWPVPRPPTWEEDANAGESIADLVRVRTAIDRGVAFGPKAWCDETANHLGWSDGPRPRGRPHTRLTDRKN